MWATVWGPLWALEMALVSEVWSALVSLGLEMADKLAQKSDSVKGRQTAPQLL